MAKMKYFGDGIYITQDQYKEYLNLLATDVNEAEKWKQNLYQKNGKVYSSLLTTENKKPGTNLDNAKESFEAGANPFKDLWKGLTGQTSAEATLKANQMNLENQNYWNQITMQREDTAYQRQMADLQAAGLNPWLVTGSGAHTASLNTAEVEPVDGSRMLQATSAAALLAIVKLLTGIGKGTNVNYNFKK